MASDEVLRKQLHSLHLWCASALRALLSALLIKSRAGPLTFPCHTQVTEHPPGNEQKTQYRALQNVLIKRTKLTNCCRLKEIKGAWQPFCVKPG